MAYPTYKEFAADERLATLEPNQQMEAYRRWSLGAARQLSQSPDFDEERFVELHNRGLAAFRRDIVFKPRLEEFQPEERDEDVGFFAGLRTATIQGFEQIAQSRRSRKLTDLINSREGFNADIEAAQEILPEGVELEDVAKIFGTERPSGLTESGLEQDNQEFLARLIRSRGGLQTDEEASAALARVARGARAFNQRAEMTAEAAEVQGTIEDSNAGLATLAQTDGMVAFENAETFGGALKALATNPIDVFSGLAAQALPQIAGVAAAGTGGALLGGPGGAAAGAGAFGFALEHGASYSEFLQREAAKSENRGKSLEDIISSEGFQERAETFAKKRALTISAFNAISSGVASKLNKIKSGGARFAAQAGAGAAIDAGGEAAAQFASEGRFSGKEILAEALVGPAAQVLEAGGLARANPPVETDADPNAEILAAIDRGQARLEAGGLSNADRVELREDLRKLREIAGEPPPVDRVLPDTIEDDTLDVVEQSLRDDLEAAREAGDLDAEQAAEDGLSNLNVVANDRDSYIESPVEAYENDQDRLVLQRQAELNAAVRLRDAVNETISKEKYSRDQGKRRTLLEARKELDEKVADRRLRLDEARAEAAETRPQTFPEAPATELPTRPRRGSEEFLRDRPRLADGQPAPGSGEAVATPRTQQQALDSGLENRFADAVVRGEAGRIVRRPQDEHVVAARAAQEVEGNRRRRGAETTVERLSRKPQLTEEEYQQLEAAQDELSRLNVEEIDAPATRLYGGVPLLDPEVVVQSARTVYKGTKSLAKFTTEMVKRLGDWIKPFVKDLWRDVKDRAGDLTMAALRRTGAIQFATDPEVNKISELVKRLEKPPEGKKKRKAFEGVETAEPFSETEFAEDSKFYEPQKVAEIADELAGMSKEELGSEVARDSGGRSSDPNENRSVAAHIELLARQIEDKDDWQGTADELFKRGTELGQLVNQFKLLRQRFPGALKAIIRDRAIKGGRKNLTEAQEKRLDTLSEEHAAAHAGLQDAANNARATGTEEAMQAYGEAQARAEDADVALAQMMSELIEIPFFRMLEQLVQGNLLTVMSLVKNVFGNFVQMPLRTSAKVVATPVDVAMSMLGLKPREATVGYRQASAWIRGATRGAGEGARQFLRPNELQGGKIDMRYRGLRPFTSLKLALTDPNLTTKQRITRGVEGTLGVPAEIMFRALNLGDKPFLRGAEASLLAEQGKLRGLKGKELRQFIALPDKKALDAIDQEVKAAVFIQDNAAANWVNSGFTALQKTPGVGPALSFLLRNFVPYVKFPANFITEVIQYAVPEISAINAIRHAKNGDGRKAELAFGKMMVGATLGMTAKMLAEQGLIEAGPAETDKERSLQFAGLKPYGINASGIRRWLAGGDPSPQDGDKIYGFQALGLFGAILGIEAEKHADRVKDGRSEGRTVDFNRQGEDATGMLSSVLGSRGHNIIATAQHGFDQSFLKGMSTALDVLSKDERGAKNVARSLANSMLSLYIPNSLAGLEKAWQEYLPEMRADSTADTFKNAAFAKVRTIPGAIGLDGSESFFPRRLDPFGDPIRRTPEGANPFYYQNLDPVKSSRLSMPRHMQEIRRLFEETKDQRVMPSQVPMKFTRKGKSFVLTPEQHERLARGVGAARKARVLALFETVSYQNAPPEQQVEMVEAEYDKVGRREGKDIKNEILDEMDQGEYIDRGKSANPFGFGGGDFDLGF